MTTNLYALNRDGTDPGGHILPNLLRFAEVLRRVGLDAGPANVLDMVRATEHVHIGRRAEFYQAARSIFVHRRQDLPVFDEAFNVFWRKPNTARSGMDLRSMGEQRRFRKPQVSAGRDEPMDDTLALEGDQDDEAVSNIDLTRTYSAREVLRQKDFAQFSGQEISEARRMMASLQWDLGARRTRRMIPGEGSRLDVRRSLRRSLQYGGEMFDLAERGPKSRPRSLALICDVSGSMERYTRMLLHFIHTVTSGQSSSPQQVEAFLFATRLTRITRQLRYRSIDQAITEVSRAVPDWAGGTRIGDAVKTFNYQWLRRTLRGQAIVMIISDGWDRGEPELLARETSRLQRSCHRLIWLNPLLGSASYQPLTQGMQAALPYVDDFLPVHNMNSLQALAQHLSEIGPERGSVRAYRPEREEQEAEPPPEPQERPIDRILPRPTFRHPMWGKER